MKKTVFKGKNVEEAIRGGAEVLGLSPDKVEHKVISEGKHGMLGMIGAEEAEVEVWEKLDVAERARETLQEILDKMQMLALAEIANSDSESVTVNVIGEDMGQIIGKDGSMLKALQTLLSTMINRGAGGRTRITVDAGGYWEKHEQALERIAKDAAKDVEASGMEKILPHMNARDRRIIHIALKDNLAVETNSIGIGADRRLVISPKK